MLSCSDIIIGTISILYLGQLILTIVSIICVYARCLVLSSATFDAPLIYIWLPINEILLVTVYLMFVQQELLLKWICGNLPNCADIKRFCCDNLFYLPNLCNDFVAETKLCTKVIAATLTGASFIGLILFLDHGISKGDLGAVSTIL